MTPDRPIVMVLTSFYLPGFRGGGPIRSVANLVEALGSEQQFLLVTADRDLGSDGPYAGIRDGVFQSVGKASVRYLAPRERGLAIRGILRSTPYDVLYLNSFFAPRFTILPLVLRRFGAIPRKPIVVAPRGEFSPGALELKATKKRLWLLVARLLGLYRDATWHATTEDEADLIRSTIGKDAHVIVARMLVAGPLTEHDREERSHPVKQQGSAKIVFLSRIDRKKNLGGAISLVSSIDRGSVALDIYGTIDDEAYWRECQGMMDASNPRVSIRYRGDIPHSEVSTVLSQYDLFLLPTLGENFGHAIVEALAAGCPIAISDRTPWAQIEEAGAGWALPLDDLRRWEAVIQEVVDSDEDALTPRRLAARRLALASASGEEDVEHYRHLFRAHAGG